MALYPNTISIPAGNVTGTLGATNGGTAQSSYASGDTLYASAVNTLSKLAKGSDGQVLTLASGVPSWATASGGLTLKQYVSGTSYTNGTPAVTSPNTTASLVRGVLIPYQTSDGAWRMIFTATVSITADTDTQVEFDFSGVLFKNIAGYHQAVSCSIDNGSSSALTAEAVANHNYVLIQSTSSINNINSKVSVSGDVELNAKPSWAD